MLSFELLRQLLAVFLLGSLTASAQTAGSGTEQDLNIVSLFDGFVPQGEQASIRAGTSNYDATKDIELALATVSGTGKKLLIPAGTYTVGEVVFTGKDYTVETTGVTFRQRNGLTGDGAIHPIITFAPEAENIRLGDIRLVGNIATDRDEYSHGIAVISANDITIGDVSGEDIRGDVLYTYGRTTSEAEMQRNLVTGVVTGSNVYRSIVAMAGGQASIAGVVQRGPVGYRDVDIEPNPGGAYQPVEATIGFVRGSTVQITSADPKVRNKTVSINSLDLDGDRIANTSPSYPGHPGANAVALAINRTDSALIGSLRLRHYDSYPVQLADGWKSIRIDLLDFAASDRVERTYKSIVLQHGKAGAGVLSIGLVRGVLWDSDRFVLRSDIGLLRVKLERVEVRGGALGLYLQGYVGELNGTHRDAAGLCPVGCESLSIRQLGSGT